MKKLARVSVLMFIVLLNACAQKKESTFPQYLPLTESVYSSVIIEAVDLYKVYAVVPGIIDQLLVKEGDLVQRGDTIFSIINDPSEYQQRNAALELKLAQQNYEGTSNILRELQSQWSIAQLQFENDSQNYERQARLWEKGIGSKIELEERKIRFVSAKNQLNMMENQINRTKEELRIKVSKAQNNLETNRFQNEEYIIKSRINGRVYKFLKEQGESVNQQEAVAFIGRSDSFLLKMQVDEVDIVNIRQGQKVWVSLDAYEDKVFEAVIDNIVPKMDQETQTFWVEGSFIETPEVLYSGLRGEANIVVQEREKVLTIPRSYLQENMEVLTEDGTVKVAIGKSNLTLIEIINGLDTATRIYKP